MNQIEENAKLITIIANCIQAFGYIMRHDDIQKAQMRLITPDGKPLLKQAESPKEVATYMVAEIQDTLQKIKDAAGEAPHKEVQLKDGDEIVFSTDVDVTYHKCCRCGLLHQIEVEFDNQGPLYYECKTKWTQIDRLPTEDEVKESGGNVIQFPGGENDGKG